MRNSYRVEFDPYAARQLRKLDSQIKRQLRVAIDALAADPYAPNLDVQPMKGEAGSLRLRIGNYRVIYEVHENELLVWVIKLGHRKQIYDR